MKGYALVFKKGKFYDKISQKEITRKCANRRLKKGLKNTFIVVINSEDIIQNKKVI